MKKLILAVGMGFLLVLLAGPTWAGGFHGGFHSGGARVFIGHGHPFFHDRFFVGHRPFIGRPFFHRGIVVSRFPTRVIVSPRFGGVHPFQARVMTPGSWHWNGFQWVWMSGG
jgi:hypothetical protein